MTLILSWHEFYRRYKNKDPLLVNRNKIINKIIINDNYLNAEINEETSILIPANEMKTVRKRRYGLF